jgi:Mn-dependent DtxR family transcriptional regulator
MGQVLCHGALGHFGRIIVENAINLTIVYQRSGLPDMISIPESLRVSVFLSSLLFWQNLKNRKILVCYQTFFNYECSILFAMDSTDGLELSAKKVEYLKYLSGQEYFVKTNNLASRFGVDPSTITKTISELAESGYITHTPYHGVRLSDKGIRYAEFCIKRHRILALMLTHYGLSHELACTEVSRFEGLVSRDAINRICHAMGHPRQGVCGEIVQNTACPECKEPGKT